MQYSFDAVRHVKQGDCVVGAYSWGSHDAVERWNRRAQATESALATANARIAGLEVGFKALLALYEAEFGPEDIVRPRWVSELLPEPPHEA